MKIKYRSFPPLFNSSSLMSLWIWLVDLLQKMKYNLQRKKKKKKKEVGRKSIFNSTPLTSSLWKTFWNESHAFRFTFSE